jgi:hypothetical protein
VLYGIDEERREVQIQAIGVKEGNRLIVGGPLKGEIAGERTLEQADEATGALWHAFVDGHRLRDQA